MQTALTFFLAIVGGASHSFSLDHSASTIHAAPGQSHLAAADLNGDNQFDLVIASESNDELIVLMGRGDGSFDSPRAFPAGHDSGHVDLADLNGDGHLDAVIANHEVRYLTLLLGDGAGAFAPAGNSPLTIDISPHPHHALVRDLDHDGQNDILVDHRDGEAVAMLRGLGDGHFDPSPTLVAVGGDPYRGFAVGDLDGNGRLDLVSPNPRSVGVVLNGQDGFKASPSLPAPSPFAVALGDFNDDGFMDVLAASDAPRGLVQIFQGDGTGAFAELASFTLPAGGNSIATGDANGDGVDDALITSWNRGAVLIIGDAQSPQSHHVPLHEIANPWGALLADFNGDGRDDVLIGDGASDSVLLLLSQVP